MISLQIGTQPQNWWYNFFKDFTPTFVAIVAAVIASVIAYRQWKTARDKLKFDLYEIRFQYYDKIRSFIAGHLRNGEIEFNDFKQFTYDMRGIEFVFDEKMRIYVESICKCSTHMSQYKSEYKSDVHSVSGDQVKAYHDRFKWMSEQFDELDIRVKPFLKLSH